MSFDTARAKANQNTIPRYREVALLIVILLGTVGLRVIGSREIPASLSYDELINVDQLHRMLKGDLILFSTTDFGREPLFFYLTTGIWLLAGKSVFTYRLSTMLAGLFGVVTTYILARRLTKHPALALLAATGMMAAFVPLFFGRVGLRVITLPPFVALAAYGLWRGLEPGEGRTMRWFILAGVSTGLAIYTYPASRLLPLTLLAFVGYLLIFHRDWLKGRWWGLLAFIALAGVIAFPVVWFLMANPDAEVRIDQLTGPIDALKAGDPSFLIRNSIEVLLQFILKGDTDFLYNIANRPFFSLPAAILFYAGVALALWRWRQPAWAFALLLLAGGLAPSMVSVPTPSWVHTISILPVVFIFPALILVEGGAWLARRGAVKQNLITALVVILTLAYVGGELYAYFGVWARSPEGRSFYNPEVLAAVRYLEESDDDSVTISGPGMDYWNPWTRLAVDITLQRDMERRWFHGQNSFLVPADVDDDLYVILNSAPLNPVWEPYFAQAELVNGTIDFNNVPLFQAYRLADLAAVNTQLAQAGATNPVYTPAGDVVPAGQANFGGHVNLLGYTIESEVSHPGEMLRLQTFWRVNAPAEAWHIVFVHLLDENGNWAAGWDDLDIPPQSWQVGDTFALHHELVVPGEAGTGMYRFAVGWYSPETLLRWPAFEGGNQIGDHVLLTDVRIE